MSKQWLAALNGRHHQAALLAFMAVVLAHWAEHVVQAVQIWGMHTPRPQALGLLGSYYPWLVRSEWLHYGYALVMLIGLIVLRPGFTGAARTWWTTALVIQVWHHLEHLLLLVQAMTGVYLLGRAVPTSVLQLAWPRVELHLFYNAVVFVPMVVAMYLHLRPSPADLAAMDCSCRPSRTRTREVVTA